MNHEDKYVDEKYVSEFLGLALATVRDMRFHSRGPGWHKFGRAVRYRLSEVRAWAEAQKVAA